MEPYEKRQKLLDWAKETLADPFITESNPERTIAKYILEVVEELTASEEILSLAHRWKTQYPEDSAELSEIATKVAMLEKEVAREKLLREYE